MTKTKFQIGIRLPMFTIQTQSWFSQKTIHILATKVGVIMESIEQD